MLNHLLEIIFTILLSQDSGWVCWISGCSFLDSFFILDSLNFGWICLELY